MYDITPEIYACSFASADLSHNLDTLVKQQRQYHLNKVCLWLLYLSTETTAVAIMSSVLIEELPDEEHVADNSSYVVAHLTEGFKCQVELTSVVRWW